VGIDFLAKPLCYNGRNYRLQLWDTAGQERFRSLIPSYLKNAICGIIVFDLSSRRSFESVRRWFELFKDNRASNSISVVVGNKLDLPREVTEEEGLKLAQELAMEYFEVSAKTNEHIDRVFEKIIEQLSANNLGNSLNFSRMSNEVRPAPTEMMQEIKEEKEK
jgi:Ras-related protein Rab-6A